MRGVFPSLWLAPRGLAALWGLAAFLAVTSVVPWIVWMLCGMTIVFMVLLSIDWYYDPARYPLRVRREPIERLVLARRAAISYFVENDAPVPMRVGLYETPVPGVRFEREELAFTLSGRSRRRVEQHLVPQERGKAAFGALYLWVENGIGLLRRRYVVAAADASDVFPDLSDVMRPGALISRQTLLERGLRKVRSRGVGSEYESLREYVPGDAFRSVNWKATARRGRLTVRQYEMERDAQVLILLDCGRLMTARMGEVRKFDHVLTAALSTARIACEADDHVGFHAFAARRLLTIPARRGRSHIAAITRAVFAFQPRLEEPDYDLAFADAQRRFTKRGLIVFFTDILDPVASAATLEGLRRLARRHAVLCVLMNDAAVVDVLSEKPVTLRQAYRFGTALRSARERAEGIARLRAHGVTVVDVPASRLTSASLDAYLDLKRRGSV